MSNVLKFKPREVSEHFSCAFRIGEGGKVLKAGYGFMHENPNQRIMDLLMERRGDIIREFYSAYGSDDREYYCVAAIAVLSPEGAFSLHEIQEISNDVGFDS